MRNSKWVFSGHPACPAGWRDLSANGTCRNHVHEITRSVCFFFFFPRVLCFVFVLACFPKVSKDHRKLEGVVTGIFIKSFVAAHALWRVGTRSPRKGTPNTTQSSQVRGPRGTPPPRPGERRKGSPPRPTGRVAGCAPTPAAFTRAGSARSRRPPRHDAPWPRRETRVQRRHG